MRTAVTLITTLMFLWSPFLPARCQAAPDPLRSLLAEAVKESSLGVEGTPAFRIEGKFSISDYSGKSVSTGTLATEFLRPGFTKLTVHDDGSPAQPSPTNGSFMQRLLIDLFLHPGPAPDELESYSLKEKNQKFGPLTLRCITLEPVRSETNRFGVPLQVYCLSMDSPVLRFVQERSSLTVVYNDLVHVLGHTAAREVAIQQSGKTIAKLSVTKFTSAPNLKVTDFPEESEVHFEDFGSKALAGRLISKATPRYPDDAKRDHVSGTVLLHVLIGKDGSIEHLEVISAPSNSLAEASLEAVRKWKYAPYIQNGVFTKVDTGVMVNFAFGF